MKKIKQQNNAYYLNPHYYSYHQPENLSNPQKVPITKNHMGLFISFFVGTGLGFLLSHKKAQKSSAHWKSVRNELEKVKNQLMDMQKIF